MSDFFTARVEFYDEHMLTEVKGAREAYTQMAALIPDDTANILDLGCGTGLELDEILKRFPQVSIAGIDITRAMLDKLVKKFPERNIRLICGNYYDVSFGENEFDTAISFQTMHHFPPQQKAVLYRKILGALRANGVYIECDYMIEEQSLQDELLAQNRKIRLEMNIPENECCHFDIPCTVNNQLKLFKEAGFSSAEMVWRMENTAMIVARKGLEN